MLSVNHKNHFPLIFNYKKIFYHQFAAKQLPSVINNCRKNTFLHSFIVEHNWKYAPYHGGSACTSHLDEDKEGGQRIFTDIYSIFHMVKWWLSKPMGYDCIINSIEEAYLSMPTTQMSLML